MSPKEAFASYVASQGKPIVVKNPVKNVLGHVVGSWKGQVTR